MKTTNFKTFNYLENDEIDFSILDTIKTTSKLDSGFYDLSVERISMGDLKIKLKIRKNIENFDIHGFPYRNKIENLFSAFFNKEVISFLKLKNILNKTGLLFYGKEGTGKTSIMKHYCNRFIKENNAIVFNFTSNGLGLEKCFDFIRNIRQIQDNTIICVIDEVDSILKYDNSLEAILKIFLDGHISIDNFIFFASTNYIDDIPDSLKNRESRFKYTLNIEGIQEIIFIKQIVSNLLKDKFEEKEIDKISNSLSGKTLDEIKQFCLDKIMDLNNYKKTKKTIGFKN